MAISSDNEKNIFFEISSNFNFSNTSKEYIDADRLPQLSSGQNFIITMQKNDVNIKSISYDGDKKAVIGIRQNAFLDVSESSDFVLQSLEASGLGGFDEVTVKNYLFGEVVAIDKTDLKSNTRTMQKQVPDYELLYASNESFPLITYDLFPNLRTLLGAREDFCTMDWVLAAM